MLGLAQRVRIEEQERLIALFTELKKALLHQLMTVQIRVDALNLNELLPCKEQL